MNENWVTVEQAAKLTKRTTWTIYRWVREGDIRTLRPGRTVWVFWPDVVRVESEKLPGRPRGVSG